MIYIYRTAASESAAEVAWALRNLGIESRRVRSLEGLTLSAGDRLVCWGEHLDEGRFPAAQVLGGAAPIRSKLTDARMLQQAGVRTIEFTTSQPTITRRITEVEVPSVTIHNQGEADAAIRNIQAALARLNQPVEEWLPRRTAHEDGDDLLRPPARPGWWTKKIDFASEFRVHSFKGQSIQAGVKQPRVNFPNPHPWIRSWQAGWDIRYTGVQQPHRDIAKQALEALGLDFGAVDIGQKADGTLVVLEVNRAPGVEGSLASAYARAIQRWIGGGR